MSGQWRTGETAQRSAKRNLNPFDLVEPLLRSLYHLLEAAQDIRIEDRPKRAPIPRDLAALSSLRASG
jgi:DnaJ-domain-containing protein 1